MATRLDILLFGATGFTGIRCIPYLYKLSKEHNRNLSWGIAGRSEKKLKEALQKTGKELGVDLSSVPIIIADINNYDSLLNMARKTRLVLSCCGPYKYLGYEVIKACIETGAHQIDVTAEPDFMMRVQVEHGQAAKDKEVYVINACGFDCIPIDLGAVYTQKNFQGTLNSIEMIYMVRVPIPGPYMNFTTFQSAVATFDWKVLRDWRRLSNIWNESKNLPKLEPELKFKVLPHKHKYTNFWQGPYPTSDMQVAKVTQTSLYETKKIRPAQVTTYLGFETGFETVVGSMFVIIGIYILCLVIFLVAQCQCGRNLLLKFPKIFTATLVDHQPPSDENLKKCHFDLTIYGEGWTEKPADPTDKFEGPPNKCILGKLTDSNGVYSMTCIAAVLASIIVLTETDNLPNNGKGGVYTPGFAFSGTSMVEQLDKNGLKFEVLHQKNL